MQFTAPSGYALDPQGGQSTPGTTGQTHAFTVAAGQAVDTIDAGLYRCVPPPSPFAQGLTGCTLLEVDIYPIGRRVGGL